MNTKGFTLLEILLTILIIAIGTTALLSTFSRAIFISGTVSDLRTATALAEAKMEELKSTAYGSLSNESRSAVTDFTGFEREVTVTEPNTNLKQIVVTVYWKTKGGELSKSLTTYIVNKNN